MIPYINPKWRMEQHPAEIEGFVAFAREFLQSERPEAVLELGVRHGGTSALWHEVFHGALVIGVDRVGVDSYQEPEFTQRALEMEAEFPRYHFVAGDTGDLNTFLHVSRVLDGREVSLLFIDADHSYEGVSRDYGLYLPFVETGGLIAFHDIVDTPYTGGGVTRFWNEVKQRHNHHWEFCIHGDWGGIGVVQK